MSFSRHFISDKPDSVSPGGGAEIRLILQTEAGDLAHAVCPAGQTAPTHELPELDEAYFILAGRGEIWRRYDGHEGISKLRAGIFVWMPAGTQFQYRASGGESLVFLVAVMPSWRPELFHTIEAGPWHDGATEPDEASADDLVADWMSGALHHAPDHIAPDGSEIRSLGGVENGSLAHCLLPAGACSAPVRHRSVHEIWYTIAGHGELWRASDEGGHIDVLWPGVGVDIAPGVAFQFRTTGFEPLQLILLTVPKWPGPDEAINLDGGCWRPRAAVAPGPLS